MVAIATVKLQACIWEACLSWKSLRWQHGYIIQCHRPYNSSPWGAPTTYRAKERYLPLEVSLLGLQGTRRVRLISWYSCTNCAFLHNCNIHIFILSAHTGCRLALRYAVRLADYYLENYKPARSDFCTQILPAHPLHRHDGFLDNQLYMWHPSLKLCWADLVTSNIPATNLQN